ncbi:HGGxSTG domain-containing protein [Microbacterium sp. NPDC089695]|uniref:HGGxSTG domain-containing protein n=1 Tax=Microbacterium sp. NPDC089695 TaxID=3364198 RepID=UPI00381D6892
MSRVHCNAITRAGTPCRRWAVHGSKVCQAHGGGKHKPNDVIAKALDGIDAPRCRYTKRNGEQCKNAPIKGGTVCKKHGGAAAHIQRKAQERLQAMVMPALVELNKILEAPSTSDGDKLRAVSMVLDRTGFGKGVTIEHKQDKPWEVTMQAIIMPVAEDYTTGTEDIEDAEVVEESLPPVRDMSKLERFDGPRIVPDAETGRGRVRGSANPLR